MPENLKGLNILLIDNNQGVGRTLGKIVNLLGHNFLHVFNFSQALYAYGIAKEKGKPYDIIILDHNIPGKIRTFDLKKYIREDNPDQKIGLMSGYDVESILENGFDYRLQKPFEISTVKDILESIRSDLP